MPFSRFFFFKILWDKKRVASDGTLLYRKLNFDVLEGEPNAKAWVNFRANHHCERAHRAPAIRPFPLTTERPGFDPGSIGPVLVNHPHAVRVMRDRLAKFFSLLNPTIGARDFSARLAHRGERVLESVAEVLGSVVPFYTVTVE